MPFTLSHTLAAVPLRRLLGKRAVPSALVIGTMVPDFRHLIPRFDFLATHTFGALLWFVLPVGLATYLLFHSLLSEPALALLPLSVRRRMGRFIRSSPSELRPGLLAVVVCLVVGAISHLAWDGVTHRETFVVDHFHGVFAAVLWHRGHHYLFVYSVIQYGTSALGLVLLVAWCRRWLARQPIDESIGPAATASERAVGVCLVVGAPVLALLVRFVAMLLGGQWVGMAAGLAVRLAARVFVVSALVFALVWRLRHGRAAA